MSSCPQTLDQTHPKAGSRPRDPVGVPDCPGTLLDAGVSIDFDETLASLWLGPQV